MAFYSRYFDQFHASANPERQKLWDPVQTLGIINLEYPGITCIGKARTKARRCQNPINASNRSLITKTLDELSYLDPHSLAVLSQLRSIAGPALCVRNHQDQAETVIEKWKRKLDRLSPVVQGVGYGGEAGGSGQLTVPRRSRETVQAQIRDARRMVAMLHADEERIRADERRREEQRRRNEERIREEQRRRSEQRIRELEEENRIMEEELARERARTRARERRERERAERERAEDERLEQERLRRERLARERQRRERSERERSERERAASNQRMRQNAQRRREEAERRRVAEREEWTQLWTEYQDDWVQFRDSDLQGVRIRDVIPWPVKSGSYRDVNRPNVKEFLQKAPPADVRVANIMRRECLKWHPDCFDRLTRGAVVTDEDRMMVAMICRVVTGLLNAVD